LVILVVSFLLAFPPIAYVHSSSPPFVLNALRISSSLTSSFWLHLAKSTSYEAPQYAAMSNSNRNCNEEMWRSFLHILKVKSKSCYDRRSVSQYVVVSSSLWNSWPDVIFCLNVAMLSLWGALSDERSGLSSVSHFQQCLVHIL
jgi:hypothetical protein